MSERNSPFEKHSSHVHIGGESYGPTFRHGDWRNGITVSRPRVWEPRPDLIGKTVVLHSCFESEKHEREGNLCSCNLIGKPVVITAIAHSNRTFTAYRIAESEKLIYERSFSDETRGKDWDDVVGYILEGPDGMFLGAGFAWLSAERPLDGYLHNAGVVRDLLTAEFPNGRPTKAYPASSKLDGDQKRITGDAVTFDQLTL